MRDIILMDVYESPECWQFLYDLLKQRTPEISISHKKMPAFGEHEIFIRTRPYKNWFVAVFTFEVTIPGVDVSRPVASVYLTHSNEIGVFVDQGHRGKGIGKDLVQEIIKRNGPGRYLANINPKNETSIRMFDGLGFRHIQNTYEINAP